MTTNGLLKLSTDWSVLKLVWCSSSFGGAWQDEGGGLSKEDSGWGDMKMLRDQEWRSVWPGILPASWPCWLLLPPLPPPRRTSITGVPYALSLGVVSRNKAKGGHQGKRGTSCLVLCSPPLRHFSICPREGGPGLHMCPCPWTALQWAKVNSSRDGHSMWTWIFSVDQWREHKRGAQGS